MKFAEYRKAVAAIAVPVLSGFATLLGLQNDLSGEVINALTTIFTVIAISTGAIVYLVPNEKPNV